MLEIGTQLQGRYVIEELIGQGGMGAVYLAVDQKFSVSNRVAIKETFYESPELAEAFEREARLLNSLHHPILPHVSDYFTEGGGNFLVMEYIEGEDLSEILRRDGAFPLDNVMRWTQEILDGLDYLHSQEPPVVHRDIKPNNLKLTSRGFIVLLDFGLAKENEDVTLGERSVFGYSKRYSPLEQIEGVGTDARSDIFSLGATVYQLLTGRPPIDALARASAIVAGQPDPLVLASEIDTEIPDSVAHVLHSALALNADQRFASAKAMSAALDFALNPDAPIVANDEAEQMSGFLPNVAGVAAFPALQAFKAELEENVPDFVHEDSIPVISHSPEAPEIHEITEAIDSTSESEVPMIAAPAEAEPVQPLELGVVDAVAPHDETETAVISPPVDTHPDEGKVPAASVSYTNPRSQTAWQKGAVWLGIVVVCLLALAYAVSQYSPTADAESAAGTDNAPAAEQPDTASAVSPESAETSSKTADTVAEPKAKSPKPVTNAKAVVTNEPDKGQTSKFEEIDEPVSRRVEAPPAKTQTPVRNVLVQQARRTPRAAEQRVPVSRIEDVFTGISPQEERQLRRQQRLEDEAAEEEAIRRERRRMRRQVRQNGWPF